jgi:hypothetical protein
MAEVNFTRSKSRLAGGFTLAGKRRASASARVGTWSVGAYLMLVALGAPAAAFPNMGPTSSASVGISVSVAPKYGLRANELGIRALEDGTAGLCMATNGPPIDLPVRLVRQTADVSSAGWMAKGAADELHWCLAGGRAIESMAPGNDGEGTSLLIVLPE